MKLLVTGATGYIGRRLVRRALAQGHEVVAASRRSPAAGIEWLPFELAAREPLQLPQPVDAIVHLAAVTGSQAVDEEVELGAARTLLAAARACGARFVFVSSQTARADAPTAYGRSKWRIEQEVLAAGAVAVRPGQVYGGPEAGLFGTLAQAVRRLPVLPAFLPAPRIQPVHVDDLAEALLRCASQPGLEGRVLGFGDPEPVTFTAFLRAIADGRVRRPRWFVPVPTALVRLAARLTGSAPLVRLSSLFELPMLPSARADLRAIGLELRPLAAGMARSRRRALVEEARTLLAYVLREPPAMALVRRYVRCIELLRGGQALALPANVISQPWQAGALERGPDELRWRIDAAAAIAEASPQGARRFLRAGASGGWLGACLRLARAVMLEATLRVLRRP